MNNLHLFSIRKTGIIRITQNVPILLQYKSRSEAEPECARNNHCNAPFPLHMVPHLWEVWQG
jgi:hypothetical protein